VSISGLTPASPTDSGLVLATSAFQVIGTYDLTFKNNDVVTRQLTGAFLSFRVKA
jgi:hypothetical protein